MSELTDRRLRIRDLFNRKQVIEEYAEVATDSTQALLSDEQLLSEYRAILKELIELL